ncbi:hypothetical protein Nepgr_030614 [Nepenthes gracilis]|uniref:Uncharacterized protein n=1 Tax=Nepenthes gracilis TaxID=150966 RepID=A0AAD3Y6R2_NEPGR|nr:hypothetical protein Nepgr_030614 [Nepenthes gracilis]
MSCRSLKGEFNSLQVEFGYNLLLGVGVQSSKQQTSQPLPHHPFVAESNSSMLNLVVNCSLEFEFTPPSCEMIACHSLRVEFNSFELHLVTNCSFELEYMFLNETTVPLSSAEFSISLPSPSVFDYHITFKLNCLYSKTNVMGQEASAIPGANDRWRTKMQIQPKLIKELYYTGQD